MIVESSTVALPTSWAIALINGDLSAYTPEEIAAIDAALSSLGDWYVVAYVKDSNRACDGGMVMDYVIHKEITECTA